MPGLSPVQRRELKARAHSLKPVVLIGASGLTPTVVAEIDRSLKSHELIKVRASGIDRGAREALLAEVCLRTGAEPVQQIGKILVIFRETPEASPREAEPQRDGVPRAGYREQTTKHLGKRQAVRRASPRTTAPRLRPYQPVSRRKSRSKR